MRSFRLKISPPKKTFRLRCFFFMAATALMKPPRLSPDNSIQPASPPSRAQVDRVLRRPRQERGRVPVHPRLVSCPEIGRERIRGLPAWHVEYPLVLVTRRDGEALARPERGFLDARHVRISGQGVGGHAEEGRRPSRERLGKR